MSVLDREARRAAQLAARAEWTPTKLVDRQADRIRPGAFIERIPTQHGVRGLVVEAIVEAVEHDWETWRHGRYPVPSVRYMFARTGRATAIAVCIPASFTVQVRVENRTQQPT